jgi:23S rRNA (uracil-5-)-methyltransferase RumA
MFKENKVKNLFDEWKVNNIIPSPKTIYYRNRMDYPIYGKVSLKEPLKWWSYIPIEECKMLSKEAELIIYKFNEFIEKFNIPSWDTVKHTGFLRYLIIREGKFTGERMLHIITYERKKFEELWKFIEEIKDLVTSVYWGIRRDLGDVSISEELKHFYGTRFLREKINDIIYYISPNAFFQTNSYQAVNLANKVREYLDPQKEDIVLDLYSGLGFFSLQIANEVKKVIGVESVEESIEMAKLNARINGINNAEFYALSVEDFNLKEKVNKVVVDPPRSGMSLKAIRKVLETNAEKIIYVSCNPITQRRDIEHFLRKYEIGEIQPLDMFPNTPHVENIIVLERK